MEKLISSASSPFFRTLNIQIKEFEFYTGEENINEDNLFFEINFDIDSIDTTFCSLFLHVLLGYELSNMDNDSHLTCYHADHMVSFDLKHSTNEDEIDALSLASFLGTSYVMAKGAYQNSTRGYLINAFPFPIIKPIELIKKKFNLNKNSDVVSFNQILS